MRPRDGEFSFTFIDGALSHATLKIPLYARVDGISRDGAFLLMELELIEPNLFFGHAPGGGGAIGGSDCAARRGRGAGYEGQYRRFLGRFTSSE